MLSSIATEFVSTNARTLKRPPDDWMFGGDKQHWFDGYNQNLSTDYLHEGATGVSGNVYEPYLPGCVRPEYLLPAYFQGRTLADSYYLSLPYLSWFPGLASFPGFPALTRWVTFWRSETRARVRNQREP